MWTHPPGSHRKVTRFLHLPSAVLALVFVARRIQPSLSLVNREVYRNLWTQPRINRSPLVGHALFLFLIFFCEEKSQFV